MCSTTLGDLTHGNLKETAKRKKNPLSQVYQVDDKETTINLQMNITNQNRERERENTNACTDLNQNDNMHTRNNLEVV